MIPEDVVAEILQRTDIVELIGSYLPLRAAGKAHKALCPFHTEKTPSFVVNPERQIFHCFGCGEGGDAIAFLVKHERFTFPDAVRFLAERAGVPLRLERGAAGPDRDGRLLLFEVQREAAAHFRANLLGSEGAGARNYLANRGLTPEVADRFQLGYALPRWDGLLRALRSRTYSEKVLEAAGLIVPRQNGSGHYDRFRHRVMIPIWDVSGKVVAFGGRALPPAATLSPGQPGAGQTGDLSAPACPAPERDADRCNAQAGGRQEARAGLPGRGTQAGDVQEVKYLNSPETAIYRKGTHLYGLNLAARAIRERKQAIVVEGYFDAIALHAAGVEQAVATLGTALTPEQARLLGRYTGTIILLFDPDAPGIGAARRNLEQLINVELDWRIVLLPDGLDPDEFIRRNGAESFAEALGHGQDLVEFFLDQRVSGLDLKDPVQRARATDRLIEVVALIDNPIRRQGYLQRIAQKTGMPDRVLGEAVGRQRGRAGRQDAALPPAPPPAMPPTAEEQLIFIALSYPEWRARIAAALKPEDVEEPMLRRIFTEYVLQPATGAGPRPTSLLPPEVERRLASLWLRDAHLGGEEPPQEAAETTVARTVGDCMAKIAQRSIRAAQQSRQQALQAAARAGDNERALALLQEQLSARSRDKTQEGG
ncbi:MAG: DNA primase [candidate division NC10 bacterium]|nr:DNA primase [candidate division NC10 bacterium]